MAKYPIFLEMEDKRVVVIGAGTVAVRKAQTLLETGARVVIIDEHIYPAIEVLCAEYKKAELIKARYAKEYLSGAMLAIAATNNNEVNRQIYRDCQESEVLCNVVDEPELCDFFVPAIVKRGELQIAVCTAGQCPAYAGHIRTKLEQVITEKHGQFLAELHCLRTKVLNDITDPTQRKTLLGKLADDDSFQFFIDHGSEKWHIHANDLIYEFSALR